MPLTGTAAFTPVTGKSYELLAEIKGTPTDADGAGPESCRAFVRVLANGVPIGGVEIEADDTTPPPFNVQPFDGDSLPIGLLSPGQAQTLTANSFGDNGCSAATTATLRLVVVEFG